MTAAKPGAKRLVIVDDDAAFVDALGLAISLTPHMTVVDSAHDADSGLDVVVRARPDLLVADYRLRNSVSGVELAKRARGSGYQGPIAILTGYTAPQIVREADHVPRTIVLSKQDRVMELVTAFGQMIAGSRQIGLAARCGVLSDGELEVLEAINAGHVASEIARDLHVSIHTVRSRVKSLMRKLDVSSQVEAIAVATRMGLLVPPS